MGRFNSKRFTDKDFVRAYMESDYNHQVASKLGIQTEYVAQIAVRLRKRGVKLPTRTRTINMTPRKELNDLIKIMEKEQAK